MNEVIVEIDRAAIARYGINASEVNETLEAGLAGRVVGTFIEGQRRFSVRVRLAEESRHGRAGLENLLVPALGGGGGCRSGNWPEWLPGGALSGES